MGCVRRQIHRIKAQSLKPTKRPDGKVPSELSWPIFCLRYLQRGYDVDDLSPDDQRGLIRRLRILSQLEWSEIEQSPRHGVGKENIDQIAIRQPLPSVVTKDITLWAFRFSGKKPMVGFRSGAVFHILWMDHDFSVYQHSR